MSAAQSAFGEGQASPPPSLPSSCNRSRPASILMLLAASELLFLSSMEMKCVAVSSIDRALCKIPLRKRLGT